MRISVRKMLKYRETRAQQGLNAINKMLKLYTNKRIYIYICMNLKNTVIFIFKFMRTYSGGIYYVQIFKKIINFTISDSANGVKFSSTWE